MNDGIFSLKVMEEINSNFCFELDDEYSVNPTLVEKKNAEREKCRKSNVES
jgi:hypothetical protein